MSTLRTSRRFAPTSPGRARGFTLLELIIAMTAGLFVSIAAYAMARQGSRFFQQEARIANAQYSLTLGIDRLRADLSRAGFLSSPDITVDPRVCGDRTTWASDLTNLSTLAAVRLFQRGSLAGQDGANGLYPDRIVLSGSYATAEMFPVRTVEQVTNKYAVYLQVREGAMTRAAGGQMNATALGDIFKAGRGMRILDGGRTVFGVIDSFSVTGGVPIVMLTADAPLPFKRTAAAKCGIGGLCIGCQASVINWIVYELRDMHSNPGNYAPLFDPATATAPGDATRLELVRYEEDAKGGEVAGTLELISEYAVDLKFAFTVADGIANPVKADVARFDFDNGQNAGAQPGTIRSVHFRVAVRSREADRDEAIPLDGGNPYGNLYRYSIPGVGFARVRTVTADVELLNLSEFTWH
jgi:prepilin-type N-terminal cleavage/methylation domain-containing protein